MNYFMDTSALIKKYIQERGSETIEVLMDKADIIYVASLTKIECFSVIKRLLQDKLISASDYSRMKKEMMTDFDYYTIVKFNDVIEEAAARLLDSHQLKTLDAVQAASVSVMRDKINAFVVCDKNLIKFGKSEKIHTIDPSVATKM